MRTYKSQIGRIYYTLVGIIFLLMAYSLCLHYYTWALLLMALFLVLLDSLRSTTYDVDEKGIMTVKCSLLPKYSVRLSQVKEVRCVISGRPAYALSQRRLLLILEGRSYLVSPENPQEFIQMMRYYNHRLKVTTSDEQ